MATPRLPVVGKDEGTWGEILNTFLVQAHNPDGTIKQGAVTLSASDVGAIATSQRAAANGVASLDGSAKVPVSQVPDLSAIYLSGSSAQSLGVPLFVTEANGSYPNRPTWNGVVIFMGADAPASGGTQAGGTPKAVAGLDVWFRTA